MNLNEALLAELKHESIVTRKMLEKAPPDKYDWKPHEKSMTLGTLTAHIAEISAWLIYISNDEEFDIGKNEYRPNVFTTTEDLLKFFDETLVRSTPALQGTGNERLMGNWKFKRNDHVIFELPRIVVVRNMVLNHVIHHRGQLSVYLRLLDISLPSVYGPTADERM